MSGAQVTTFHKAKAGELLVDYLNDDEGFKECRDALAQALAEAEAAEREACAEAMDEWEASESIASPAAIIRARTSEPDEETRTG